MNEMKESRHIVAFLDLLGASELMKGEKSQDTLIQIKEVFKIVKDSWCNEHDNLWSDIKIKIFSDNIAFARALPEEENEIIIQTKIAQFVSLISIFQSFALQKKLVFRGGITIGNLYIDDVIIWGAALDNAVFLEKKVAVFPRVVVNKTAFFGVANVLEDIEKDFDGIWFVSFLSNIVGGKECLLEQVKAIVDENKKQFPSKLNILQKYEWLENYIQRHEDKQNT